MTDRARRVPAPSPPLREARGGESRVVRVEPLTLVDGEGSLVVRVKGGRAVEARLRVSEPPRFLPALLAGRHLSEVPDLSARLCGGCSVSHQLVAVEAVESACGVAVDGPVRSLRRLLALGERIASHVRHVTMRHAPGFLGHESGFALAKERPGLFARALALRKAGAALVRAIGGREVHPVNVRVGGFHRVPSRRELAPLAADLVEVRPIAEELLVFAGALRGPGHLLRHAAVALRIAADGAPSGHRIVTARGLEVPVTAFEAVVATEAAAGSTALHGRPVSGGSWATGPIARYELLGGAASPVAREAAGRAGLAPPPLGDPFRAAAVRALETLAAVDEALRLLGAYVPPDEPSVPVVPRAGTGAAAAESPRGLLYHRYRIGADGLVEEARVVTPTMLNLPAVEDELEAFVSARLDLPPHDLARQCAQLARCYDPCLPCATA